MSTRTILGFGASSMQGVGDPEGGFFKRLERQAAAAGLAWTFRNHGVGGNTTRDMLARLPAVQAEPADTVVVLLGCNDLARRNDGWPQHRLQLAETTANLQRLFAGLRRQRSLFISSFQADPERSGIAAADFAAFMAAALAVVREQPGWAVWDLYAESLTWNGRYLGPDGVHCGGDGHALIAAGIAQRIGLG